MIVTCQAEGFVAALPEIIPLINDHWEEVGSYKDEFRRDIDYGAYAKLETDGRLLTVTARDDGRLIGYFVGVTGVDLHRMTKSTPPGRVRVLSALVYYICPESRGHARALIRAVEREAAARRIQIVNIRVKPDMNAADAFLRAIGYRPMEMTFTRLIGDAAHARARPKVA